LGLDDAGVWGCEALLGSGSGSGGWRLERGTGLGKQEEMEVGRVLREGGEGGRVGVSC
jgi:hypothetical protein